MIRLTRLSGKPFVLACEHLLLVEATPDTLVTLTDGQKCLVRETVAEVARLALAYRRAVATPDATAAAVSAPAAHAVPIPEDRGEPFISGEEMSGGRVLAPPFSRRSRENGGPGGPL